MPSPDEHATDFLILRHALFDRSTRRESFCLLGIVLQHVPPHGCSCMMTRHAMAQYDGSGAVAPFPKSWLIVALLHPLQQQLQNLLLQNPA